MKIKLLLVSIMCGAMLNAQTDPLGVSRFHHLHLNSTNPEAAIAFYTRQFPSVSKITFAGAPALKSPNNVLVLFTEVNAPPPLQPQTAIWHFGWHVTDVRKNMETYKQRPEVKLLPLYTTDEGGSVFVSSDTWPGTGGVLGLTKAQISEAIAKGVQPAGAPLEEGLPAGAFRGGRGQPVRLRARAADLQGQRLVLRADVQAGADAGGVGRVRQVAGVVPG